MIRLRFQSELATGAEAVLAAAMTMPGVNAELMPLLRMSYPAQYRALDAKQAPLNRRLFRSWLLLFGFLPVDLHALAHQRLAAVGVREVHGGGECTISDSRRYFSHRRDGRSGRLATLVWTLKN